MAWRAEPPTIDGESLSLPACDGALAAQVCRGARTALLAIRSQRHDLIGAAFGGSAVDVEMSPRIGRHRAGLEIRSIPDRCIVGPLCQRRETFAAGRIAADVEVEEVE